LQTGLIPNDDAEVFNKDYSDFASIAIPRDGAGGSWYLDCRFDPRATGSLGAGGDTVNEVEVNLFEGAYHEAEFTDQDTANLSWCLDFDGVDDYLSLASAPPFGFSFTFEAWVLPKAWNGTIASFDTFAARDIVNISILEDGRLFLWLSSGLSDLITLTSPDHLYLDTPTHIAVVVSGATATIYRNGTF